MKARRLDWKRLRSVLGIPIVVAIPLLWLGGCMWHEEGLQLKVVAELPKTEFQVGEEISIKPYLINMGKQPVTVSGGIPILFVKVYDAKDNVFLFHVPEVMLLICAPRTIEPAVPYYDYNLSFTLEHPGRYKIIPLASFSLGLGCRPADSVHVYGEPIWIEVVNRTS